MGFSVIVPSYAANAGSPVFNSDLCPVSSVGVHVYAEPTFITLVKPISIMRERLLGKEVGYSQPLGDVFRMPGCHAYEAMAGLTLPSTTVASCYAALEMAKAEKAVPS